ncbi:flavodoxin [Histomonas meleagridis]|uniref:flavodoxin n=1 Tax=Histomonas meleagridis TaxID=135588 RepID=UPI00355A72D6|nr:flavodoxin [Histomonas meleagridis]KAH0799018.1 flavodoxin [Histomonas meleagridis]
MSLEGKRILIAYYSKTNVTKNIAGFIKEITGGDEFRVEPVTPYPQDYHQTTQQAKQEQQAGFRPEIVSKGDISNYDVIFFGSPCWWGTIACPMETFITSHDFRGKTIIPFITHGGSGLGRTVEEIKKLAPGANVVYGKAFGDPQWVSGSGKTDVAKWISSIKL